MSLIYVMREIDSVKRFQIHLLREYMESKEDMDFQRWRAELEDRREEVAKEISESTGIAEYQLLYSTREYKKTRVKYFV